MDKKTTVNKSLAEGKEAKVKASKEQNQSELKAAKDNIATKSKSASAKAKKPAEEKNETSKKQEFGDIVHMPNLIKRTIMVAAYPALVKSETEDGIEKFLGFLPGFEFCSVEGISEIGECMQLLQDKLDDEVESLILKNEGLPFLPDDEELLKAYPGFEIKMLDINVWAFPDEGCDCCGDGHEHSHCGCGSCEDEGDHGHCGCGCCGDDEDN